MAIGARRRARAYALQVLYSLEFGENDIDRAILEVSDRFEIPLDPGLSGYVRALVGGVRNDMPQLDELIGQSSKNWRLERMARVDRNILRIATWELLRSPDMPSSVILNESIEVAKEFGTEDSPGFVNGILDRIRTLARPNGDAVCESA